MRLLGSQRREGRQAGGAMAQKTSIPLGLHLQALLSPISWRLVLAPRVLREEGSGTGTISCYLVVHACPQTPTGPQEH